MDSNGIFSCSEKPQMSNTVKEPPSPPASPWAMQQRKLTGLGPLSTTYGTSDGPDDPMFCEDESISFSGPLFISGADDLPSIPGRAATSYLFVPPKRKGSIRLNADPLPADDNLDRSVQHSLATYKAYNANPGAYLKRVWEDNRRIFKTQRARVPTPRRLTDRGQKIHPPLGRESQFIAADACKKPQARVASKSGIGLASAATENPKLPHTRAPSIKRPEDVKFEALPDFSPPSSGLSSIKALKIEWTSHNPLDLSSDPHRHLLHEAEISLASTLRLSCATYLCSKRRIFAKVRDAYEMGKEFRKTDAQQACQIDVNKASKLWVAFDKVGWFKKSHFESTKRQHNPS